MDVIDNSHFERVKDFLKSNDNATLTINHDSKIDPQERLTGK